MTAKKLHEQLRIYSGLKSTDNVLFTVFLCILIKNELTIDSINSLLKRINDADVSDEVIRVFSQSHLNQFNKELLCSPIEYFYNLLKNNIIDTDISCLYSELVHYESSDKQNLGIVLTPSYITELMYGLLDVSDNDSVLDMCCGTGELLRYAKKGIGIELRKDLSVIAKLGFLLYGRLNSEMSYENIKIQRGNCFDVSLTNFDVGILNPPYAQGSKAQSEQYEVNFIIKLLSQIKTGGKAAVIVPQSVFCTGFRQSELRNSLLKKHTLNCIISLKDTTFGQVRVTPCIALFTANIPQADTKCMFYDFSEDKCILSKGKITPTEQTYSCIDAIIKSYRSGENDGYRLTEEDDWTYANYITHCSTSIEQYRKTVKDYILFQCRQTMEGRSYLFSQPMEANLPINATANRYVPITDIFDFAVAKSNRKKKDKSNAGYYPFLTSRSVNNGHYDYYDWYTEEGGCIAIESAVQGYSSYQHTPFGAGDHIIKLLPKFRMNKYHALYFVAQLNALHSKKFCYGFKPRLDRLSKELLKVPLTENGLIDFNMISSFIKKEYQSLANEVKKYAL